MPTIIVGCYPSPEFTLPDGRKDARVFLRFCADAHPCDHHAILRNVVNEHPDAVIFTLSPLVIAASYAKDVYLPDDNHVLRHPDCETFGLTPNQIYTNVFKVPLRCPEFAEELKRARAVVGSDPEAAARYTQMLALGAASTSTADAMP